MTSSIAPYHTVWVLPGRLLAGGYPGESEEWELPGLLGALLELGVTFFLDLTEPTEHGTVPYEPVLRDAARQLDRDIAYRRMPIVDFGVPTAAQMREIIATLDGALDEGRLVYLHCFAGIGRTATAAGCYLVSTGLSPQAALEELASLRRRTAFADLPYPATLEQRAFVEAWPP